ncbi:hypothetical protein HDU79_002134 [Rhizoclosmatium sp. JEL0117]|nr:hypothetical protein HDU79_002134 [Rhizoclosmatium sp. JEL0117]
MPRKRCWKTWLNPTLQLRAQGLSDPLTVTLSQKLYFYPNAPITTANLSRLYHESKHSILSGRTLCKVDEAIAFAGLILQCHLGNHEPDVHTARVLNLLELVPEEYVKQRDIAKRILKAHGKLHGLSAVTAMRQFIRLVRSLEYHGVTFYKVQELTYTKKSNAQHFLLGISKTSIICLNQTTHSREYVHLLSSLIRWSATTTTLTLVFQDEIYISYTTTDADEIASFIQGYLNLTATHSQNNPNVDLIQSTITQLRNLPSSPTPMSTVTLLITLAKIITTATSTESNLSPHLTTLLNIAPTHLSETITLLESIQTPHLQPTTESISLALTPQTPETEELKELARFHPLFTQGRCLTRADICCGVGNHEVVEKLILRVRQVSGFVETSLEVRSDVESEPVDLDEISVSSLEQSREEYCVKDFSSIVDVVNDDPVLAEMIVDDIESKHDSAECADEINSEISNLEVDENNEKESSHEVHEKAVQEIDKEEYQVHDGLKTSEDESIHPSDNVSVEVRGATLDVEAQLVATDSEQTLATIDEDDLATSKEITESDTVAEVVYPTEHQFLIMQLNIKTAANNLPAPPIGKPSIRNIIEFDETFPSGSVKAITAAVSNLIHCASRVQLERSSNKVHHVESATKQHYFSDGTWTQGLISAAKQVASATTELCKISSEQSNEAGETTHDGVIVSAKSISAATAHLLASATSGITNPSSESQVALKAAGKAVLAAVDDFINNLPIVTVEDIHPPTSTTTNSIRAKVMEFNARVSVLKMERELEIARMKLSAVRKNHYQK